MRHAITLCLLLAGSAATAQDLAVYDDALQNGFSNYSYGAPAAAFGQGTTVRSGAAAIGFTPTAFNAVSFAHEAMTFSPLQYRGMRFFVHGGSSSGQAIQVNVYSALGTVIATAPLASYIAGGTIAAGEWREVNVVFAAAPLSYTGSFVRVDLQDGGDGTAQATLYFDDVSLLAVGGPVFADGFEGAAVGAPGQLRFTAAAASIDEDGGMLALTVERVGGSSGAASVEFASVDGAATAPDDYSAADGMLTWNDGEAGNRTLQVAIVDDADDEGGETFAVMLSNAIGAALAAPVTTTVTIIDDDDPPPAACGLGVERDVDVAQMSSDRFTWCDAAGQPRVAVLAHNDGQVGPGGARGGALREFRYRMPNASERVATVTTYGNAGYGGFGYVVSHARNPANCVGDDSPLGYAIPGAFQRVFEGRHHAIFRFTQQYPRNCSVAGPALARPLPVTIDWVFATGRDHPLWAISYDLSAYAAGTFDDDSRAPYGELNIDGNGFAAPIDGVGWGDRYRFANTTAPLHLDSEWDWTAPNSVPYVKLWMNPPHDATMGLVQSQTMTQQDAGGGRNAGGYDVSFFWNKTSAEGDAGAGYAMPLQNEWPYQANAFSIGVGAANANNNARLTWGTQYGFLGQTLYEVNDGVVASAAGYPKKSYSVFVILGPHSLAPVEAQRIQIETVQGVTASTSIGGVAGTGPPGVNRAGDAAVAYQPAGYDHVYAAWTFDAAGNALDANLAIAAGTLRQPLLVLRGYSAGALPAQVQLNGALLVQDVDYFPSLRADAQELWLTLDRELTGAVNRIEVVP